MKIRRFFHILSKIYCFVFGETIGRICYGNRYLSGIHFKNVRSDGWAWVTQEFLSQKVFGLCREVPWPVSPNVRVTGWENVIFDNDDMNNFQTFGTYFQAFDAKIIIGKGTLIAPNVGLITANHDPTNLKEHVRGKDIVFGKQCWVGMNSVILPGVCLGDHTIVGAGSVVTKSFPDGHCVIAGNPAKVVKT